MSENGASKDEPCDAPSADVKPQSYITESGLPVGPQPDVVYPVTVVYCGNCGLPTEVGQCYQFLALQITLSPFFF